ncbi:DUF262 domain-containing HNH endonuclease family protein [Mannheimia sp. HC-2023]|uniref:DUF262 domain-containing protein n=1 Tax=Mannheimia indoligenes TaxID=3103145 RepID=UPI002FE650B6
MNKKQVKTLYVKELCNIDKYIVPIYQRNYAWGKDEIELLIQDIEEAQKTAKDKNYYIGSLVVAKRLDAYEVIDGQQRLTTLKLLLSYYNQKYQDQKDIHLTFEHREASNYSLSNLTNSSKESDSIRLGYQIISNILEQKSNLSGKENLDIKEFFTFLLNNVVILRTEVPEDTDLNHYFEIMNNRGEQLEHHEVLKAKLMSSLKDDKEKKLFALIWDACSDMSVYAIKRFPSDIRTSDEFFGENCHKIPSSFDSMKNKLSEVLGKKSDEANGENTSEDADGKNGKMIISLLNEEYIESKNKDNKKGYDEIKDGKFNSIIDFPNFLMIVLKIYKKGSDVKLNDKEMISEFVSLNKNEIIEFSLCLLRCRLLFDRYIIKTKDDEDDWLLLGLKKYDDGNFKEINSFSRAFSNDDGSDNDEPASDVKEYKLDNYYQHIIHILSMFHTSFRSKIYKNWLFDVLYKISEHSSLKDKDSYNLKDDVYLTILEEIADQHYQKSKSDSPNFFENGQSTPHYIFNYLDYLLWKNWDKYLEKENRFITKNQFRFSLSRTSIEHYLAQNLAPEGSKVHNFGNLCLISPHQNSALSDYETTTKRSFYEGASKRFDCMSLKQAIMLSKENWTETDIEEHCEDMKKLLDTKPSQNK